jgi:hypothetical protein
MPKTGCMSDPGRRNRPSPTTTCSAPVCIDLEERFGRRYRIEDEESCRAQYGRRAEVNDPWLKVILCRGGHIYPWGASTLAAATDRPGRAARKLAALPTVSLVQDGSDGVTVLFDVADFATVAKIMRPRRRRGGDKKALRRLAEVGAKTRFQHGAGFRCGAQILARTASDGSGAIPADGAFFHR